MKVSIIILLPVLVAVLVGCEKTPQVTAIPTATVTDAPALQSAPTTTSTPAPGPTPTPIATPSPPATTVILAVAPTATMTGIPEATSTVTSEPTPPAEPIEIDADVLLTPPEQGIGPSDQETDTVEDENLDLVGYLGGSTLASFVQGNARPETRTKNILE